MTIPSLALIAATHVDELLKPYREPTVESSGIPVYWWLLTLFVLVAIGLVAFQFVRERTLDVTPDTLLRELCYAHRIGTTERQLLSNIAEKATLTNPASMFVTAKNFDAAIESSSLSLKFTRREQATLRHLRRQLFSLMPSS